MKFSSLRMKGLLPWVGLLGLMPVLAGCSIFAAAPHYRGIAVSQHDLDELTPGTSTEADVTALLGSPTAHEAFNDRNWLYISQVTKRRIGQTQGVLAQNVVVMKFNSQGVLEHISHLDKKDQVQIAMAPGHTKQPGGTPGFFQQLVGGVGSYNPLGASGLGGGLGSGLGGGTPGGGPGIQ
ncbi:MAG: hypothetical protein B7Z78_10985 [Rhodospirillales bacterium 20-60-12]|nr:MAG: hypothetical protein B7Z78_10985 [Rhodospirillales bacterium 20-60-12]HQT68663.1 outer membrane protein assembly factor BamE [Acetobacteraceae bacterium]